MNFRALNKAIAHCPEPDRFQVERDMLRQIKIIYDENNASISFPARPNDNHD